MYPRNNEDIEKLFGLQETLTITVLEAHLADISRQDLDIHSAIKILDQKISDLHNHTLLLSLFIKQRYLLAASTATEKQQDALYTKQEVAVTYRVSVRTVNNWIQNGLAIMNVGGVIRIKKASLEEFIKSHKSKKFHWRTTGKKSNFH